MSAPQTKLHLDPFKRLVKMVARAFYESVKEETKEPKPGEKPRRGKATVKTETRGLPVVVLDALTRRQWIKEDELARQLKLAPKFLTRTLRMLQKEMLVMREETKEAPPENQTASTGPGARGAKPGVVFYCALDYAQVYDVVRYRLHRAKKLLKEKLESRKEVMELICSNPSCGAKFSTMEMDRLIDPVDPSNPKCARCSCDLVTEMDKEAHEAVGNAAAGDGADEEATRRMHKDKLKGTLERFERQLAPLRQQLEAVKELNPPFFGKLHDWLASATPQQRAIAAGTFVPSAVPRAPANRGGGAHDPFSGETKVEIAIGEADNGAGDKKGKGGPLKVLPPWAIREGMNLTATQRGELERAAGGVAGASSGVDGDGAGPSTEGAAVQPVDEEAERMKAYYEAYYKAVYEQQQQLQQQQQQQQEHLVEGEGEGAVAAPPATDVENEDDGRQGGVGRKRKAEEDVEWEDGEGEEGGGVAGAGASGEGVEGQQQQQQDDVEWEDEEGEGAETVEAEGNGGPDGGFGEGDDDVEWE